MFPLRDLLSPDRWRSHIATRFRLCTSVLLEFRAEVCPKLSAKLQNDHSFPSYQESSMRCRESQEASSRAHSPLWTKEVSGTSYCRRSPLVRTAPEAAATSPNFDANPRRECVPLRGSRSATCVFPHSESLHAALAPSRA